HSLSSCLPPPRAPPPFLHDALPIFLVIATNAGLIGISRLSWSLAEHRHLPSVFARVHRRYRTPWFTIAFFSVLAGLLVIPGETRSEEQTSVLESRVDVVCRLPLDEQ